MGDVIHNLPVITDIQKQIPDTAIDWVVEESFSQLPRLHPGIRKVIPVALRRWRKSLTQATTLREIRDFVTTLREDVYDVVLDTQGLVKSAVIAKLAHGERRGYAWGSAREALATGIYNRRFVVDTKLHAVERNRQLAAKALGYELQSLALDYGIKAPGDRCSWLPNTPYAVLLHATSRDDKLWPENDWISLGKNFLHRGIHCVLPWGNATEKARSERLASALTHSHIPDEMSLNDATTLLAHATIVVGVDTGLTHLAAALGTNVVALYVATSPGLTGVYGEKNAVNLGSAGQPPTITNVWDVVTKLINSESKNGS